MSEHKTPFKYAHGEIRDADGRQLLVLMPSNCTKKFRDRVGKTLVGILNAEERGKCLAQPPAMTGRDDADQA